MAEHRFGLDLEAKDSDRTWERPTASRIVNPRRISIQAIFSALTYWMVSKRVELLG